MKTKTAFIFPGQGSQSAGMMDAYANDCGEVRDTFARASDVLGKDLYALAAEGPKDALDATVNTQPIMLSACFSLWSIWQRRGGGMPDMMAGHSFGEYAALVCAGAIAFEDGIRIAAKRGELMQDAVPGISAAMAAVMGVDAQSLGAHCRRAQDDSGLVVEMVNFNAPTQIVVAGHRQAIDALSANIKTAAASKAVKVIVLPVSVPAHSSLMKPAAEQLAAFLENIEVKTPAIPVVQNVEAKAYSAPEDIKQALNKQVYNPVLWAETVAHFTQAGAQRLVEMGPGQVLTGIARRIDRNLVCMPTDTPDKLEALLSGSDGL